MRTAIVHADVVLPDRVLRDAAVVVEDGVITAVEPASTPADETVDLRGATLLPGLIDLHGDAIEKEVEPRPNVRFPLDFAVAEADKRYAAAGITTAFHAISFAPGELGLRCNDSAAAICRAIQAHAPHALVDNRVHCRYEVTDDAALPLLLDLIADGTAAMISFMDHTPGQGQFKAMGDYVRYLVRTYRHSERDATAIAERKAGGAAAAVGRVRELARACAAHDVPLASHDDDDADRVATVREVGVRISEFPVNLAAATAARAAGMSTVFGAPNVLRGGSQSGSVRAADAVRAGVADCLCSDYSPASLLPAALKLVADGLADLPTAVAMVTANPATAAGLSDRGRIATGCRADLIAVRTVGGRPFVNAGWVGGRPVLRLHPPGAGATP
ncbi:MAG TPA: phosphonate metabolism protein PhnM [Tepidisphaeraceae bacterium]|nr:phosphonate metabolism protein PhnM [Tepidisphaeraceae bacterium]